MHYVVSSINHKTDDDTFMSYYCDNFTVSDETGTFFNCAVDYIKRGKRLNLLTHWDIQVTGGR